MAGVDDYIAQRADSFGVIRQTVNGLIPLDFAGQSPANLIAAGVGELIEQKAINTGLKVTLKFVNGGIVSGILNFAQDEGHPVRAFITGAAGGTLGAMLVDRAMGATAGEALAALIAESTFASGLSLAGAGFAGGALDTG